MLNIFYDKGIFVESRGRRVLIDPVGLPRKKPDVVLISHAHRDHCNKRVIQSLNVPIILSEATRDFLGLQASSNHIIVSPGEQVEVGGLQIEAHNAGHILGSLQFRISLDKSVVYTGDFNFEPRIILNPADILKADVLIVEATYGHPRYVFPPRRELYPQLIEKVLKLLSEGLMVTLAARPLGVSQELTAVLSLSKVSVPIVHEKIWRYNVLYEKYGENLGRYLVYHSEKYVREKPLIAPLTVKRNKITCTGWSVTSRHGIPLSSHSDFKGIVRYVRKSQAEEIYTVYGFSKFLAEYLERELGIPSTPLERSNR